MKAFSSLKHHILLALCSLLLPLTLSATHFKAADISVEQIGCDGLTYRFTINAYLDVNSGVAFGGGNAVLDFGDGQWVAVPELPTAPRPELGNDIGFSSYSTVHTYSTPGVYLISYAEGFRNEGILNMDNSANTNLSVSVWLNLLNPFGCNNLPEFAIPPIDHACSGVAFSYTSGAFDVDGDSLSYHLLIPSGGAQMGVLNYKFPNDSKFYIHQTPGNEEGNGPPVFEIDPATGLITWDAPGLPGPYSVAFAVTEWRWDPILSSYTELSTIVRDMQIVVEDCNNRRPEIGVPEDICIVAGTSLNEKIVGSDRDGNDVKIESYSQVYEFPDDNSPATYSPEIAGFRPSIPPDTLTFQWDTNCRHVRDQPYRITFKITDNPPQGPPLSTYKTWSVKVLAPAPEWEDISVDYINRHATLTWREYPCEVETIQVWRKVAAANYSPTPCDNGLPGYLGYELVGELLPGDEQFLDTNGNKGLAVGAAYCYRLLAVLGVPTTPSIVSEEFCVDPILIDAPVITHASIEKTHYSEGTLRVSWRSPFEISKDQFPGPYQYQLFRGIDFSGEENIVPASGLLFDTTFLDTGLNTEERAYHYYIVLYSNTIQNNNSYFPIDTSAVASSIRLEVTPGSQMVRLQWEGIVPWSNVAPENRRHLVFRGVPGTAPDVMTLIDSVDVTANGFRYSDRGQYQNIFIDPNKLYCYRIVTRGTYGNPKIGLLENASQVNCSYPENNLLPCAPRVSIALIDCDAYVKVDNCSRPLYSNSLSWDEPVETGCRQDILSYNVYAADSPDAEFILVAEKIRGNVFVDSNRQAPARCYRIQSVDRLGRISPLSEPVCQDNCPYFELPNVFTPNGDGCNDYFQPYFSPQGDESGNCPVSESSRCPRFVNNLSLKIYNRWGIEVYSYHSSPENVVSFAWDGKDANGNTLESAVYYFTANVQYDVIDPANKNKKIKGWVRLID